MHHLLKRQLKKTGATVDEKFLKLVNQAYKDADEDRNLLEHSLDISSMEMKELHKQLEKKSLEKLKRSEEKYERLTEALRGHYFFYAHDKEGVFTYVSGSMQDILGYKPSDFFEHYSRYLTNASINKEVPSLIQKAIDGEQQEPYIVSTYKKNGEVCYLEVSEFPVYDEYSNVVELEGIAEDITSKHLKEKRLDYISQHDALTGILNRRSLYQHFEYLTNTPLSKNKYHSVLFLDLDYFKEVNDTLGHDIGDLVLKESVRRIESSIRKSDLFARIGGDEFVVVMSDVDKNSVSNIAMKIVETLRKEFFIRKQSIKISTSIGISLFSKDSKSFDALLKYADEAMYRTKESGRDGYTFYS